MGIIAPNLTSDLATLRNDFAAEVLRNIVKDGWSVLNLSAGIADALVDQAGISNLGGATYDGTGHSLGNPAAYVLYTPTGAAYGDTVGYNSPATAFDGNVVNRAQTSCACAFASTGYVGKAFSSAQSISQVKVWSSNNCGFGDGSTPGTVNIYIYGKSTAPASGTDGVLIGSSGAFTDTVTGTVKTINCSGGSYQYVWAYIVNTRTVVAISQVQFFTSAAPPSITTQSIAFVPAAPVSSVRLVSLWQPVDVSSLGIDCLMDATANGGTNWSGIALSDLGKFDASTRIIGGMVNVTPGSLVAWRWRTANAKSQLLKGVFVQWK